MPDRAKSALEIAQRACILAGMNRIESFDEFSSTEAVVLSSIYEDIARDCLSVMRWNFVTQRKVLTSRNSTAPLTGYGAAYTYLGEEPDDVLMVHTIEINGSVVAYDISENEIHVDANATDEVVMTYSRRVDELFWPAFFVPYVTYRVASVLAASIVRNAGMAEAFEKMAAIQLSRARNADGQQVTSRGLKLNRLVSTRSVGGRR